MAAIYQFSRSYPSLHVLDNNIGAVNAVCEKDCYGTSQRSSIEELFGTRVAGMKTYETRLSM